MSKKADDLSSRVVNTAERSNTRLYLWFKVSSGREVTASQVGCAEFLRMEKAADILQQLFGCCAFNTEKEVCSNIRNV